MVFLLCVILATFVAPSIASAASGRVVTADRDYGRNYTTGVDRLGVFVSNRPGGLYMGRLFTGDAFAATGAGYTSAKGVSYFRARALGDFGGCAWVGPSGRVQDTSGWTGSAQASADASAPGCSASVLDWLGSADRQSFNDGSALYSQVNCPPPSTENNSSLGTFGGYTYTTKPTPVYYNLKWNWDGAQYDAASPRAPVGQIPAGTGVFYRYTTKGGAFSAVFFDGNSGSFGWAFIDAGAVKPVSYWSPASDPPNYRQFACDSTVQPATEVPPPWELWQVLAGDAAAPQL